MNWNDHIFYARPNVHLNTVLCQGLGSFREKRTSKKLKRILFLSACCLGLLVSPTISANAQQNSGYNVYANIIYHFTKYIDWPDSKKKGDFIIGIVGGSPLYNELRATMANKTVGNQRIIIKAFPASSITFYCHILFISEEESGGFKKIISKTTGTPTLIVSEYEGLAKKGSCINFIIESDRLKLEINKKNIEDRKLGIASELLQLGKIIK
jgi:hypothetical protein